MRVLLVILIQFGVFTRVTSRQRSCLHFLLLVIALFTDCGSCQWMLRKLSGYPDYTVETYYSRYGFGNDIIKTLWTTGFRRNNYPVNQIIITPPNQMRVAAAYNAKDLTRPRLHMNEALMALWKDARMKPDDLSRIEVGDIRNQPTLAGIRNAGDSLRISQSANFNVQKDDENQRVAWKHILNTPFGKGITRISEEIQKEVVAIEVTFPRSLLPWSSSKGPNISFILGHVM
ncbi:hypothetical protein LZ30DRAFT_743470 [Colletotrichum cereale]|nr:hypothetical protein LZ30DRAFT_743470 [Colletotrichum cereale]